MQPGIWRTKPEPTRLQSLQRDRSWTLFGLRLSIASRCRDGEPDRNPMVPTTADPQATPFHRHRELAWNSPRTSLKGLPAKISRGDNVASGDRELEQWNG